MLSVNRNYHIFSNGRLKRKEDTLRLDTEEGEIKHLPVENAEALFLHGQIDFNTRLLSFLNDHGVAMHVFGWFDYYSGSVMPQRGQTSGQTLISQALAYDDPIKRRRIAAQVVRGSVHNMRVNLEYYNRRGRDLAKSVRRLKQTEDNVANADGIAELMGVEATARKEYYQAFDAILDGKFTMGTRSYNPPSNEINSLLSFGNALLYANCVSAIRATALDPAVSFLHEPGERRYSLSLDIADIFKPVIPDRVTFRLVNRGQITSEDFVDELGGVLLTDPGRETYSKAFEETLERTVEHPRLKRKVSYQYLLRLEVYKLKKYLLADEPYEPFRRWW